MKTIVTNDIYTVSVDENKWRIIIEFSTEDALKRYASDITSVLQPDKLGIFWVDEKSREWQLSLSNNLHVEINLVLESLKNIFPELVFSTEEIKVVFHKGLEILQAYNHQNLMRQAKQLFEGTVRSLIEKYEFVESSGLSGEGNVYRIMWGAISRGDGDKLFIQFGEIASELQEKIQSVFEALEVGIVYDPKQKLFELNCKNKILTSSAQFMTEEMFGKPTDSELSSLVKTNVLSTWSDTTTRDRLFRIETETTFSKEGWVQKSSAKIDGSDPQVHELLRASNFLSSESQGGANQITGSRSSDSSSSSSSLSDSSSSSSSSSISNSDSRRGQKRSLEMGSDSESTPKLFKKPRIELQLSAEQQAPNDSNSESNKTHKQSGSNMKK